MGKFSQSNWKAPLKAGIAGLAMALAGCDNNDPAAVATGTTPVTPTTTVSGVAAVGAPIVGGNVTLVCSGTGTIPTILPTAAGGGWTVTLPTSLLPCAASVGGGTLGVAGPANATTLYSLIASTSLATTTANITTLTSLAMARAVQAATAQSLAAWYAAANLQLATVASGLATAQSALQTALTTAGYTLPAGFDPFTTAFTAAAGNPYDDLMENLAAAFAQASSTYAAWLQTFASAAGTPALPSYTPPDEEEPGEEEPTDPGANPLGTKNGIAITVGGHTWKLINAAVDPGTTINPGPNSRSRRALNAENPQISPVALADMTLINGVANFLLFDATLELPVVTGTTQICGPTTGTDAIFRVSTGKGEFIATSCAIDLDYYSSQGGIEGTITTATLSNTNGDTLTLNNTKFRVFKHVGIAGETSTVPASAYNVMNVTGGTFELDDGQNFVMTKDTGNVVGSSFSYGALLNDGSEQYDIYEAGANVLWVVANHFFSAVGTYNCGTRYTGLANNLMNMQLWVGDYQRELRYQSGNAGGSCVINVTKKEGDLLEADYTATLVASDNITGGPLTTTQQRTVSVNGKFRTFTTNPLVAGNGGDEGSTAPEGFHRATVEVTDGNELFTVGSKFLLLAESQSTATAYGSNNGVRVDYYRRADRPGRGFSITEGPQAAHLQLLGVPQTLGTHSCVAHDAPQAERNNGPIVQLRTDQGLNYGSNIVGGNCTLNVTTTTDDLIEGTYTATLTHATSATFDLDGSVTVTGTFTHRGRNLVP